MLTNIIPAPYRKAVYAAYALAATVIGALAIAGVNIGKAPDVLAYLGIAVGAVAAGNTNAKTRDEAGASDVALLVAAVLAVLVVLILCGRL